MVKGVGKNPQATNQFNNLSPVQKKQANESIQKDAVNVTANQKFFDKMVVHDGARESTFSKRAFAVGQPTIKDKKMAEMIKNANTSEPKKIRRK